MQKIVLLLAMLVLTFSFTDCVRHKKGCKKNYKKIKKLRKDNEHFTM
jgi:hypothetical protein